MLTRIISGAVLVLVTAAVVFLTLFFKLPIVLALFLSFTCATAVYEILNNTGIVKNKILLYGAVIYAAAIQMFYTYLNGYAWILSAIYAVFSITVCFLNSNNMSYKRMVFSVIMPVALGVCFNCIAILLNDGLEHLLLLLNFSSVCDCGAYFVGVTCGKHKLAPKISPKKTIEGSVGGIVLSIIVTGIIARLFSLQKVKLLMLITPIFCIAGMCGDLSASLIKRKTGIKDYGKIIPGHGGIMDRFDSILLIAPVYVVLYSVAVG